MADLNKLKVAELKRMLKEKGLPITGKKDDLIERLKEAMGDTASGTNGADAVEDEELNEDVLNDDDEEEDVSVVETPTKAEPKPAVKEKKPKPEQPKKVVVIPEAADNTVGTLKVLSKALSDQEKQAERAKRFGVKSDDTLKATRAERFGLAAETEKKADVKSPPAKVVSEKDAEKLKKRAERFGGSVASEGGKAEDVEKLKKRAERFGATLSTTLVKVDTEEKLLKRKARFGDSLDTSAPKSAKAAAVPEETDEKKRKRAERFGLT